MKRKNNLKIQYVLLIVAYLFIFAFMPSLHCHIQFLDYTPHCFHCHGHIELPSQTEDSDCPFCPIINLNTVFVSSIVIFFVSFALLCEKLYFKDNLYSFSLIGCKNTRAPPYFFC